MFCPQCGEKNLDDARFCKKCGAALAVTTPAESPSITSRSPLDGLSSPSDTTASSVVSFSTPTKTEREVERKPVGPPTTKEAPPDVKAVDSPPPATPPLDTKTDDSFAPPPPMAPPAEVSPADVSSPPPPPITSDQATPPQKKPKKKALVVCCSIVGIVVLLFLLLALIGTCVGNTATSNLNGPGDSYTFTVEVTGSKEVTFELPNNVNFGVTVLGPTGAMIGNFALSPQNNVVTLTGNGTFTLTVYSTYGAGFWKAKW